MSSSNNGNSTGEAHTQAGYSVSAFLTSLVTNIIIWTIEIGLFIVLRTLFKRIYEPRTVLPYQIVANHSLWKPYLNSISYRN